MSTLRFNCDFYARAMSGEKFCMFATVITFIFILDFKAATIIDAAHTIQTEPLGNCCLFLSLCRIFSCSSALCFIR